MKKDLVLLVADKDAHFTLKGVLQRPPALGIRQITFEFRVHMNHDGGVRTTGPEMLAMERQRFSHAALIMDYEGSGMNRCTATQLEAQLDERLSATWHDRGKAIVIEPEVDVWMWGTDNAIRDLVGWPLDSSIREWLRNEGFQFHANNKPVRPKEALDAVRRKANQRRSSALYEQVASKISLRSCTDAAFQRLRQQLVAWFPAQE